VHTIFRYKQSKAKDMANIDEQCILDWLTQVLDDLPSNLAEEAWLEVLVDCENTCRACINKPGIHFCTPFLPMMLRQDVSRLISLLEQEAKRAWKVWDSIQPLILERRFQTVGDIHVFAANLFDEQYFLQLRNEVAFFADYRRMGSDDKEKCEQVYTELDAVTDLVYSAEVMSMMDAMNDVRV
jgi:hypothetical protein